MKQKIYKIVKKNLISQIVLIFFGITTYFTQEISFIENKGQVKNQVNKSNNNVKYILSTNQYNVSFYADHFAYETYKANKNYPDKLNVERIEIYFKESNKNINISSYQPLKAHTNFYKNGETFLDVNSYKKLIYHNVWDGVDVEFSIHNNLLKYNYIIRNKEIKILTLKIKGATVIQDGNNLLFQGYSTTIKETIPECYYVLPNNKIVSSNVEIEAANNTIKYKLPLNRKNDYVIDPLAYGEQYTTYYGGNHLDFANSIEITKSNEVIIAGYSLSANNIATTGSYQTTISIQDAFISKFDNQGNIIWATYFGGNNEERIYTMDIDTNENIIIAGNTTSTIGLATSGTQQQFIASFDDAFIAKFSSSGQLMWSTYFGGNNHELITSVKVDNQNKIYVTGHTNSSDLPCTANAERNTLNDYENTFLGVYDEAGLLIYNSYYLSGSSNIGEAIVISENGTIYFSGTSNDTTIITNVNIHQNQNAGNLDGFIIKLSSNYQTIWKTYFGGTQNDMINSMLIDSIENLYIVGSTKSNNSISTVNSFQANYTNNWDGFCVKLDSSSSQIWGTYIGSNSIDELSALAHKDSSLWIVGFTDGNMLITDSSSTQLSNNGGMDNIILKLDLNGQKKWATYLGSSNDEFAKDICIDNNSNVLIVGQTASTNNFTTTNAHQTIYGGHGYDGFWTKLCSPVSPTILSNFGNVSICQGDTIIVNSINTFSDYIWNSGDTTSNIKIYNSGVYQLTTLDSNACPGRSDSLIVTLITTHTTPITNLDSVICYKDSLLLTIDSNYISYLWNNGVNLNSQYVLDTGSYSALVIDSLGCQHYSDTITISSNQYNFPIHILGDTIICVNGSSILFTPETFSQIYWNTNELSTSITVDTTGYYFFTAVDLNNCPIVSDSIYITEINYTTPELILDTNNLFNICWNDSISLTAEDNFYSYLWSNGDTNQTATLLLEGNYYVLATDSNSCVGISDTVKIMYFNNGRTTIDTPLGLSFCNGDSIYLIADNMLNNIYWNNTLLNTNTLSIDSVGTYFFSATDSSNCLILSDTVSTYMFSLPQVIINSIADSVCLNDSLFIACSSPNINNYYWSNGQVDSSFYTMFFTTGIFSISLEITDSNNCSNIDTVLINVVDCSLNTIQSQENFLSIYPNPANNRININSPYFVGYFNIEIINIYGEILIKKGFNMQGDHRVNISSLAAGIYFIEAFFDEQRYTVKIVKN